MNGKLSLALLAVILLFVGGRAVVQAAIPTSTTLIVNGFGDFDDLNPGDGVCDTLSALPGDQCSLRGAIQELNAQGPDTTPHRIEFDIAGTGPFTITPGSPLPLISVPVEIDGETQPGASCPTVSAPANLMIVLDGTNAGASSIGLILGFGSDGSTIRGLVIGNFEVSGVVLSSVDNKVRCNHIGVGSDGVSAMSNGSSGVVIENDGNTIGGQTAHAQRNVISGNGTQGIRMEPSADGNFVAGNFVGTTADGLNALGNSLGGIYVAGNGNVIGSETSPVPNVLAANNQYGIYILGGDDNIVRSNYIGVARDGVTALGNLGEGVIFWRDAVGNVVGGPTAEANRIAFNTGDGVRVESDSGGTPMQNEIRQNAIYANSGLGIDLGGDGVDVNDPGDGDTGENERQNYPVLASTPGSWIVDGTLDSKPNTQYTLLFYRNETCDSSGHGEGQDFLEAAWVTTDATGQAVFDEDFTGAVTTGAGITATAMDPDGNTSEYSNCVTLSPPPTPTHTPTSTAFPPTNTPTRTPTQTATLTPTPGPSPTSTYTPTAGPSPTAISSATPGPSPTPTWTASPGPSPTPTLNSTAGPSPTPTATGSLDPEPTATSSPGAHRSYLPLILK